ncbi:histidine kinase N-terminal 7TM domain-containing protein [Haladaptatus sp. DYF46]|uniref:sensor histidine kinase n=1 Tax=Haladaptatus sp. DYF46 TaxID=2886041 RepID=UPI001E45D4ED|nr:histidine kinase N-terminal 7TM domain-containing protein [Haladaptatus sp. DYF46]
MLDSLSFPGVVVLVGTVLGGAVGVGLAWYAWSNRCVPGATPFFLLISAVAGWCVSSIFLLTSSSLAPARLWMSLIGICSTAVPVLWLIFALEYTGRHDWVTAKTLPLICAEPILYTVFSLASPDHGIANASATVMTNDTLTTLSVNYTPSFYFHLVYLFVVLLSGFVFLTAFLIQADRLYRKQTVAIILAGFVPFLGISLFAFVDLGVAFGLTPVFFAASGILDALALFRYDFLNVAPLASEVVLAEMDDPVIVVADERVIEYNPAAQSLFDVDATVGSGIESVLPGLLDAVSNEESFSPSTVRQDGGAEMPIYDPRSTPIRDHHDVHRGDIFVLREITDRKRREETLRTLQSATRQFMNAERPEDIAEIAVRTADEVLDHPYSSILFPDDDGSVLRSVAMTNLLRSGLDGGLSFSDDAESMWSVFESGEPVVYESIEQLSKQPYGYLPVGCLLLLPLGEHGVLAVGSDLRKRTFTGNDRRFARILASTTETALDRARRERELRESQAMVEERTDQIEFFNGVLRHDILNGITVINGNLELLEPHVEASGKSHFETVRNWSADIGQLTEKVRSVSQTVTASESVSLETVSLSMALSRRVTKVRNTYPRVDVEADIPEELFVRGNELLGEVIENVLLNAIEHHDDESPSLVVRTRQADESVRVEIEDDGPGISEDMKTRVFDRNVTSAATGSIGFGLYFVSVMMDQYDGSVWFEDADPRGTVAVLSFPQLSPNDSLA